ncbi:MAG TPA: hypothetical protein DGD08_09930 [Gemmatimonas aurantiaca]|uniref:DUF2946 domain-containing protein n=2 Tax=Gemmatimonas aurantiaca TaxID=173480 RepID=C1A9N0_GEMAT|nr:hypothetical protein [Gemmatimonas aurantiaca]BAH39207.1 hypothetical protein GAU_2165 [Gemmatimonas aurantiaca T-27]HCT57506.1 hypothetical protein [Gemmatimonas aurantiaca]
MNQTLRGFERFPRLRRLLFVLACLQVLAPATAAIADSWSIDRRVAYAHIESETGSGCVVVHAHDCVLCAIATTPMARPAAHHVGVPASRQASIATCAQVVSRPASVTATTASRAPPVLQS